jgi:hypothetical protein
MMTGETNVSSSNITVQVKCAHCGLDYDPLEISTNTIAIVMQPCPNCLVEAYGMGMKQGAKVVDTDSQSTAVRSDIQSANPGAGENVSSPEPPIVA